VAARVVAAEAGDARVVETVAAAAAAVIAAAIARRVLDAPGFRFSLVKVCHMISISAAVRKATGLKGGDPIRVTLTVADTPQEVTLPADFAAALAGDAQASVFFGKLSNSMQRYHIDNITAAKSADTRQRRIDKAIALFRVGKQR
jgi:hypothetical protein